MSAYDSRRMDRRLRELERSDDPIKQAQAKRLRCKFEGHLEYKIETVTVREDYGTLCTVLHLGLNGNAQVDIAFPIQRIRTQEQVEDIIAGQVHSHLAKCPRCGAENKLTYHYTYTIIHELKRQMDERARKSNERESIFGRGPPDWRTW